MVKPLLWLLELYYIIAPKIRYREFGKVTSAYRITLGMLADSCPGNHLYD